MTLKHAYMYGFNTGTKILKNNYNEQESNETLITDCLETESEHYRQFASFDFLAQSFNNSRNPVEAWTEYERGVYNGIVAALKSCRK